MPSRLILSGLFRLTITETVMTLVGEAGFWPVAVGRGDFSLPGRTTRCWEDKRRADFLGAMGFSDEYDAHNIPVRGVREVLRTTAKVTFCVPACLPILPGYSCSLD